MAPSMSTACDGSSDCSEPSSVDVRCDGHFDCSRLLGAFLIPNCSPWRTIVWTLPAPSLSEHAREADHEETPRDDRPQQRVPRESGASDFSRVWRFPAVARSTYEVVRQQQCLCDHRSDCGAAIVTMCQETHNLSGSLWAPPPASQARPPPRPKSRGRNQIPNSLPAFAGEMSRNETEGENRVVPLSPNLRTPQPHRTSSYVHFLTRGAPPASTGHTRFRRADDLESIGYNADATQQLHGEISSRMDIHTST